MSGHEIGVAIAIYVTNCHKPRLTRPQRKLARPKAAMTVIQQQSQRPTKR